VRVAGVEVGGAEPVAGGDIAQAFRGATQDGRPVFVKTLPGAVPDLFPAEARGLDLLRVDGGAPVPEVVAVGDDGLVLEWVPPARPSREAAVAFGRALAELHRAGSTTFGADREGFIATVPVDNTRTASWPQFYADRRLRPMLARASLAPDGARDIEELIDRLAEVAGPAEPPARVHGDLWSGNLVWSGDGRVWLIDAASAHDGHRETDLAMLHLFGTPYLEDFVAAYDEVYPLADGWRDRIALHQVFPLLVHAVLFGGGYGSRAAAAARCAVAIR
jgi:fructosamine-3-kinase